MRKITKLMLTLALAFMAVGSVNAGNHYLVYNNGTAGANDWDKQAVVTLNASMVAGTEYVLKAKVKVSAATEGQIQPVPIFSTSENKDQWGNSADVQYLEGRSLTTDFVEQVWYFTASFTHDKIQFFIGKIGGDVYFDDVTLKEKDGSTEMIDNGSFTDANISNWGRNWGGPSFTKWDYEESIKVEAAGYTTFSNIKNINVDGVVTAYKAKYDGSSVKLTEVTEIPAGAGVIIKAEAGTYTAPAINNADAITNNDLLVSDGNIEGDGTIYVLANKDKGPGFYKLANGISVPAGKAYLKVAVGAPDFLGFGGETTGIDEVRGQMEDVRCEYYNLAGQRVAQPTKGLYIVNGKKVILK